VTKNLRLVSMHDVPGGPIPLGTPMISSSYVITAVTGVPANGLGAAGYRRPEFHF
jgi:hypothetical protein